MERNGLNPTGVILSKKSQGQTNWITLPEACILQYLHWALSQQLGQFSTLATALRHVFDLSIAVRRREETGVVSVPLILNVLFCSAAEPWWWWWLNINILLHLSSAFSLWGWRVGETGGLPGYWIYSAVQYVNIPIRLSSGCCLGSVQMDAMLHNV